jgi:hypothetical protein
VGTERTSAAVYINIFDVVNAYDQVWYPHLTEGPPLLTRSRNDAGMLAGWLRVRDLDLRCITAGSGSHSHHAGLGDQLELTGGHQFQRNRKPSATEGGVPAECSRRAIGIPVRHMHRIGRGGGQKDQSIRAHSASPVAERPHLRWRPAGWVGEAAIEHDEVVARAAHLVEQCASHSRPMSDCSLSHQTIQIASRTIRLFILLWPSTRSVNTIGISFSLNPFFQARKLISI